MPIERVVIKNRCYPLIWPTTFGWPWRSLAEDMLRDVFMRSRSPSKPQRDYANLPMEKALEKAMAVSVSGSVHLRTPQSVRFAAWRHPRNAGDLLAVGRFVPAPESTSQEGTPCLVRRKTGCGTICILDAYRSNRFSYVCELLPEILLVPR